MPIYTLCNMKVRVTGKSSLDCLECGKAHELQNTSLWRYSKVCRCGSAPLLSWKVEVTAVKSWWESDLRARSRARYLCSCAMYPCHVSNMSAVGRDIYHEYSNMYLFSGWFVRSIGSSSMTTEAPRPWNTGKKNWAWFRPNYSVWGLDLCLILLGKGEKCTYLPILSPFTKTQLW